MTQISQKIITNQLAQKLFEISDALIINFDQILEKDILSTDLEYQISVDIFQKLFFEIVSNEQITNFEICALTKFLNAICLFEPSQELVLQVKHCSDFIEV